MKPSLENLLLDFIPSCRKKSLTLVTAESCTGGLIGAALTELAGSSDVFWGGYLSYANEAKVESLGVDPITLDRDGAVSESVVRQMSEGARKKSGQSLAIAVSGVAGPGGGSPEKPVGTVWISVASSKKCLAEKHLFTGNRQEIREKTVFEAIKLAQKLV